MQFGKLYVDSALELSEAEFYSLAKGVDIGGIDKQDAYKSWLEAKPKEEKKGKSLKQKENENID